jgi:hypothetical protein
VKYLPQKTVFRSYGTEGARTRPSALFDKYFVSGNVDWLGTVHRYTNQRNSEVFNSSYERYCREKNIILPTRYRSVMPSLAASFKSAAKYDKLQPNLLPAWSLAGDWTARHFYPVMGGSAVQTSDYVLGEMDMKTSCGFPWSLHHHNKKDFLADPQARAVIDDFWDKLSEAGNTIVPIWTCSQKIELRDIEKLRLLKHRTFTAAAIEHSVATNRLCLDMNNRFYGGTSQTWSFVGATKFLQGWDRLYRRLAKHPNAFELDESEYDASLFAAAMFGQRDLRWSFLREEDRSPENKRRMWAVYDSIVHSVVVLENGELVQKHTGNPSGSSNTIVDNTMILFRLFAYAWLVLAEREGLEPSYLDFMNEVEAALNGDDNTFTTSDKVVSWFNPSTIAPVWSAIGVTTNTPCETPRELSACTFLSQGFVYDQRLRCWMPVPETEKVLSSLYAGSCVDDVRWHLLRACALRLDSYYNVECRKTLSGYIEFLNREYGTDMCGEIKDTPMNNIRSVWKSDNWIEGLYGGHEMSARVESTSSFNFSTEQIISFINNQLYAEVSCC